MDNKPAGRLWNIGRWALVGLVVFLVAFGPLVGAAHADSTYRVQTGDTLISIAARYGTTVDAIVAANGLASRSTIYAGQVLTIPSAGSNPAPQPVNTTGQNTYTVKPGDTLSDIAVRYGTTTAAIFAANNLSSNTIYAGQVLVIPPAGITPPPPTAPAPTQPPASQPPPQANPGTYTVQPGDSIIVLARKFGVTQQALAAANGLDPWARLYVGQVLKIPGAAQQPPQAPTQAPIQAPTQPPPIPTATATSVPIVAATTTPEPVSSPQTAPPGKPVEYTVQPGDNLSSIASRFGTTVQALRDLNHLGNTNFLRVGQVLTIVKGNDQANNPPPVPPTATAGNNTPTPEPTPPMGQFGPKWVDVNITDQTLIAFEGQTPVFTTKVSTGVPRHPTVEGTYRSMPSIGRR